MVKTKNKQLLSKETLENCKIKGLRRLAKFFKIKKWYKMNKAELIEEISWAINPWENC